MAASMEGEAMEALRLAEAEPKRALTLAVRLARRAEGAGDWGTAAVARRAHGLALRHCGDLGQAVSQLRDAVALGLRAGSSRLAGEARMTLAYALYEQGRTGQGLAELDAAIGELDGLPAARARTQRATILGEIGRHEEAFENYREALPVLRAAGDRLWVYRVLVNRGLARAYRYEFLAAEADLREAEQLARDLDLGVTIGYAQANLGYVLARRGDVPAALGYMDLAEECIRRYGAQVGSLLEDRSELLLSARVVPEAREVAVRAVAALRQEKRYLKLPEVRLLLARTAFLDGDSASAMRQAMRAAREFAGQERPNWAALARLAALRTQCATKQRRRVDVGQVEDVVEALSAAGQPGAALEGRLLAGELLLERGHTEQAWLHLEAATRSRGRGPAVARARGWYAAALLRQSGGHPTAAVRATRAGLRVLDGYHAVLGATDLRAYAAGNRTELAGLGLRIAVSSGRPERIFDWAERGRAHHLLHHPVRPPEDPKLADALAELRATVAAINDLPSSAAGSDQLARRQARLERQIRDHLRQMPGRGGGQLPEPVRPGALYVTLGDRALVEYVQLDGTLYAVTVVDGRVRWRQLGLLAEIEDDLVRVPFALHRLIRAGQGHSTTTAATALLHNAAARLDGTLLGACPELRDRSLVIVPTGQLQNLPWSVLPSCTDRPIAIAPSATLWHDAASVPPPQTGHVAVAAGPGLPGADAEAREVAAIYGTDPLLGEQATVAAVLHALDGALLAHLATHGTLSAHNQLFSRLRFADGSLLVYDLERLPIAPHTVVLAACDSARTTVTAGDVLLGLAATFLAQGTAQLVASVLPIPDAETTPLMTAFHHLIATGQPPAAALAAARRQLGNGLSSVAVAASFLCWGVGFAPVRIPARLAPPP